MTDGSPGRVCAINIGPNERQKRLRFGVVFGAIAVILSATLLLAPVPRLARALVFLPYFIGAMGFFQARAKT